jgi:hypothetical protein
VSANDATDWGVFVNECGVFAGGGAGSSWWAQFFIRSHPGRITTLTLSLGGGHHHVATDTKDDAEFLRDYMISKGVPKTHARVQRLSAAKAIAARRAEALQARSARVRASLNADAGQEA